MSANGRAKVFVLEIAEQLWLDDYADSNLGFPYFIVEQAFAVAVVILEEKVLVALS